MKCKLSDICNFRKGKVEVENLNTRNYISTENMLPNKGGMTDANSLPTVSLTQEYKIGDVLVSNIRPYFKKIWQARYGFSLVSVREKSKKITRKMEHLHFLDMKWGQWYI